MFELIIIAWMAWLITTDVIYAAKGEMPPRKRIRLAEIKADKAHPRYGMRGWWADLVDDALQAETRRRREKASDEAEQRAGQRAEQRAGQRRADRPVDGRVIEAGEPRRQSTRTADAPGDGTAVPTDHGPAPATTGPTRPARHGTSGKAPAATVPAPGPASGHVPSPSGPAAGHTQNSGPEPAPATAAGTASRPPVSGSGPAPVPDVGPDNDDDDYDDGYDDYEDHGGMPQGEFARARASLYGKCAYRISVPYQTPGGVHLAREQLCENSTDPESIYCSSHNPERRRRQQAATETPEPAGTPARRDDVVDTGRVDPGAPSSGDPAGADAAGTIAPVIPMFPNGTAGAVNTEKEKESDMAQPVAEVTGLQSAIAYAQGVADAHAAHGAAEGFASSLSEADYGDGVLNAVAAAQEASTNAAALWAEATARLSDALTVKEAYNQVPDAGTKEHVTSE